MTYCDTMKAMRSLSELYRLTGEDWLLEVHHILTEPTCPTAIIRADVAEEAAGEWPTFRADADTINLAIEAVVARASEWAAELESGE